MNTSVRALMGMLALLALCACASTSAQLAQAPQAEPAATSERAGRIDQQYVAQVEHIAKLRGVRVQWVNPPVKQPEKR